MAQRIQIPISFSYQTTVYVSSTSGSFTAESLAVVVPAASATCTVTNRATMNPQTVYAGLTGGSTVSPIITDSGGNVPGYVPEGSYTIAAAAGGSFGGATVNWEAVYGAGVGNIASGVVDVPQLTTAVQNLLVPPGAMFDFAGSSAPTGYLICDGSVVSQSTYANLYAAVGATWNTGGEGGGNFRLPDCRGAVTLGAGTAAWSTVRTLGKYGRPSGGTYLGEETHSLANTEMPYHNHTGTTNTVSTDHYHLVSGTTTASGSDHSHATYMYVGGSGTVDGYTGGPSFGATGTSYTGYGSGNATADHTHNFGVYSGYQSSLFGNYQHAHTVSYDGGSSGVVVPHNVMQPFAVVNKVIKI